jgi:hypothetical protein
LKFSNGEGGGSVEKKNEGGMSVVAVGSGRESKREGVIMLLTSHPCLCMCINRESQGNGGIEVMEGGLGEGTTSGKITLNFLLVLVKLKCS